MKSNMLCAFLIAMLLVSTVAFGEILTDGTKTMSSATATASLGDADDDDDDSGWYWYYTTEAGEFTYYLEADAFAKGKTDERNGWGYAAAAADADVYCPHDNLSFDAYVEIDWDTESDWVEDGPFGDEKENTGSFEAYEGVYAEHAVIAVAQIEEGTYSDASAYAEATAYPGLS